MDEQVANVDNTKMAALLTVGALLVATSIIFILNLANADGILSGSSRSSCSGSRWDCRRASCGGSTRGGSR